MLSFVFSLGRIAKKVFCSDPALYYTVPAEGERWTERGPDYRPEWITESLCKSDDKIEVRGMKSAFLSTFFWLMCISKEELEGG
jgi:hypothetical protein